MLRETSFKGSHHHKGANLDIQSVGNHVSDARKFSTTEEHFGGIPQLQRIRVRSQVISVCVVLHRVCCCSP
jgi:hypothetical protein